MATEQPTLHLGNPRSLDSMIKWIEAMTGETVTPENIERLRKALKLPEPEQK